jgi:hypothetical protein
MRYKTGYRILDLDWNTNTFRTLFHAVNGSRVIRTGKFIKADNKLVTDGKSTQYMSGFHVFKNLDDCLKYSRKFGKRDKRVVVEVDYAGGRPKLHSKAPVILADWMRVPIYYPYHFTLSFYDKHKS